MHVSVYTHIKGVSEVDMAEMCLMDAAMCVLRCSSRVHVWEIEGSTEVV